MRSIRRMVGRDPHESGRVATPLELLFDLTFVVAVGVAADLLAEFIAAGHVLLGALGFSFTMLAILVGWINFSWFASAFDTDDWAYRLCTMLQMVGVVVLTLGIPATFRSIEAGSHVDIGLLVTGYVVMRVGMLLLWVRAGRHDEQHRVTCRRNALAIVIVQVAWVALALVPLGIAPTFGFIVILGAVELLIPAFTQGRANGTPWHPHHIAERYSAFAIIALGEGVVGTVTSSRVIGGGRIDLDTAIVIGAGIAITFALWWTYFLAPFGDLLHRRPRRGYLFGYGHIPVLMAIAATGSGLHGVGLFLAGNSQLTAPAAVAAVAAPVALYLVTLYLLRLLLDGTEGGLALALLVAALVLLAGAVVVGAAGLSAPAALIVVMVATFLPVVGGELRARRLSSADRPRVASH